MRVELRVLVALGVTVAVWLAFVPTANPATGANCGVPALNAASSDHAAGAFECAGANKVRLQQSSIAGGFVLLLTAAHATRRWVSSLPEPEPADPEAATWQRLHRGASAADD